MRRWLFRILLCLFVGVVATVGVALVSAVALRNPDVGDATSWPIAVWYAEDRLNVADTQARTGGRDFIYAHYRLSHETYSSQTACPSSPTRPGLLRSAIPETTLQHAMWGLRS